MHTFMCVFRWISIYICIWLITDIIHFLHKTNHTPKLHVLYIYIHAMVLMDTCIHVHRCVMMYLYNFTPPRSNRLGDAGGVRSLGNHLTISHGFMYKSIPTNMQQDTFHILDAWCILQITFNKAQSAHVHMITLIADNTQQGTWVFIFMTTLYYALSFYIPMNYCHIRSLQANYHIYISCHAIEAYHPTIAKLDIYIYIYI